MSQTFIDQNFTDCLIRLERDITTALDTVLNAFDENSQDVAGQKIRQSLEAACMSIFQLNYGNINPNPTNNNGDSQSKIQIEAIIGNRLGTLTKIINHFGKNNGSNSAHHLEKFATDAKTNEVWKDIFLKLTYNGNTASHSNNNFTLYSDFVSSYGDFIKLIKWLYNEKLQLPTPQKITNLLEGNLLKEDERKRRTALAHYLTNLHSLFDNGIMGHETLTLSTMYIQPKIEFWGKSLKNPLNTEHNKPYSNCEAYPMLSTFIDIFLSDSPPNTYNETFKRPKARMLLLFGQPGQGKTSFCHWLLNKQIPNSKTTPLNPAELFDNGKGIVYLRLRKIGNAQDLFNNPFEVIYKEINNNEHISLDNEYISKNEFSKSLIVLDGLDELAMQGNVDKAVLEGFCKDLIRLLEKYPKMRIVLTSRHSYADLEKFHDGNELIIAQIGLLDKSQQLDWLRLYKSKTSDCKLSEEQLELINNEDAAVPYLQLDYSYLRELVTQPILLQMVAQVGLDTTAANRSTIYKKLFDTLVERTWADQQIRQLDGLRSETLRDVMREIAFAIHKSEHEYIRAGEMEKLESVQDFRESVGADDEKNIYKRLMIAFYLQEVSKKSEDDNEEDKRRHAVEFMHKSLQEYLTAEYIWEKIKELAYRNPKGKYNISDDDIINQFWRLFSDKELSEEIESYLKELIAVDTDDSIKNALFERLMENAADMLKREFLPEHGIKNLRQPLYLFRSYWHILACLRPEECTIKDNFKQEFAYMLKMQQPASRQMWHLPKAELSHTNLSKMFLMFTNLQGANLQKVNLQETNLQEANLQEANLQEANLQEVNLQEANLQEVNLQEANLQEANLQGADLQGADLQNAYLQGADLQGADLRSAYLQGVYLQGAYLQHAYLQSANLQEANLQDVNLQEASLREANLQDANLRNANLQGTNLQGAYLQLANFWATNLQDANLQGANLQGAKLRRADLRRANLYEINLQVANLHWANLQEADLQEANLQGADLHGTNLLGVKNLTLAQICQAKTLNLAQIDEPLLQQIKNSKFAYLLKKNKKKSGDEFDLI
jgi:uncharacterized protein YjbI with pentapeptide repeats